MTNVTFDPIRSLSFQAREIVKRAKAEFNPVKTFALFSGGDDSTVMLHLCRDLIDSVVHINTGIGISATRKFVRSTCRDFGVPLIELRTDPSVYRDIVLNPKNKGFPGPAFHYICYHRLKSQRLQELQRDHAPRGTRLLLLSGVRSTESARRMRTIGGVEMEAPRGRLSRCAWANPILHFSKSQLGKYRDEHSVPRNEVAALIHKSGECLCGAYAKPNELEEIAFWFPEDAEQIRQLEREASALGKTYQKWGGHDPSRKIRISPDMRLCQSCQLQFALA